MDNENLKEEENLINQNTDSNSTNNSVFKYTTIHISEEAQAMYGPPYIPLGEKIVRNVNPFFTIILFVLGFFAFISKKLSKKLKVIIITILSLLFVTYFVLYIYYVYIVQLD